MFSIFRSDESIPLINLKPHNYSTITPTPTSTSTTTPPSLPSFSTANQKSLTTTTKSDLKWWSWGAIAISVISILLTATSGASGILLSRDSESTAVLGFALESFADIFTSSFIVWRFWLQTKNELNPSDLQLLRRREEKASVGISFLFILLSLFLSFESFMRFVEKKEPKDALKLIIFAAVSIAANLWCGFTKLLIASRLKSRALREDGICTLSSAILSAGILISSVLSEYVPNTDLWYLDPVLTVCVSLFLVIWAIKNLIQKRTEKWWTFRFWFGEVVDTEV